MKLKQLLLVVLVSILSTFAGIYIYGKITRNSSAYVGLPTDGKLPANYAGFFDKNGAAAELTDFTKASESAIPAVVHIKTKIPAKQITNNLPNSKNNKGYDPFEDFFGDFFGRGFGPQIKPEQRASGSGVIISADGYIVTNNHVISDGEDGVAPEIKVNINDGKKSYNAKVIGRDASSDLAVLKIEGNNLPYLVYGNSDDIKLGQWVLAVGYPFSLEATVTAGIISAKGRSIGINSQQSQSPVESFIQTDAAVNQGNSGGALINTAGQLIGINSAILAPTGTYAGYSFAIPVNLVKKVVNDIIKFGDVKRGYIGISYPRDQSENDSYLKQAGLQGKDGVYVLAVPSDGGAAKAGIKKGDIITKVNDNAVTTGLQMSSNLAYLQPGDKVKINYIRGSKEYTTTVTLTGQPSEVKIAASEILSDKLGVDLENLDAKQAEKYRVKGGVVVKNIKNSGLLRKTRVEKGFIITHVNGSPIKNMDELAGAISNSRSSTLELSGIYPGYSGMYSYQINLDGDDDDNSGGDF
ncbi:MAG: trypsin-like peptidase domain-containing protein [Niabella sp.]